MNELQNDDIGRSFDRLNRPREYLEQDIGLGPTRQGLHARDTYWPQLAKAISDNRAGSRDRALWRALRGGSIPLRPFSAEDLAKELLTVGLTVCASDRLGIDRKTGHKAYIDVAETIARNLVPACRDRKLRIKVGDWAIDMLKTLPIFGLSPIGGALHQSGGFKKSTKDVLILTAELGDVLGDFMADQIIRKPLLAPMFEPPVPWTQVSKGGVPGYAISLCSGHHPKTEAAWRKGIADGKMGRVLDALNYIQSIPYIINAPVLAFQRSERREPVQRPDRNDMWKVRKRGRIQDQWKKYLSEKAREIELELAMHIRDRGRFWIPMHLEFRGRVIAIPHFHFGREDRVRGLFLFADPQPIGIEGLKWLKAHVAARADGNTWSRVKKPSQLSRGQRIAWTEENIEVLRKIGEAVLGGDDPQTIEWALPSEDDERYQFIAACAELVQALDVGPTFETRLPLIFDCTNSGLQHLAAMRRDRTEGRWVNITKPLEGGEITSPYDGAVIEVDPDGRKDFYGIMAAALWRRLGIENPALLDLLDGPLDRTTVKTPVMSYFYGATIIGMSDQIADEIQERNKRRRKSGNPPLPLRGSDGAFLPYELAKILYELLETRGAPRAAETRNHLIGLTELCNERKKVLRFNTLLELSVINRYFEAKTERLVCSGVYRRRRDIIVAVGETDEIKEDRAEHAIAANFVHAADATLLHLIALATAEKSIPMIPIHDCFATTAPFAADLNNIARDCFARLHEYDWLGQIWQAAREILPKDVTTPPQLERGDLDLNEVKSNEDFIN